MQLEPLACPSTDAASADSLFRLAMKHIYGDGVPEDNALAFRLLNQAHDLGHVEATYNLGICWHYSHGTTADVQRACELYHEAALAGYGKAMELMGRFCNRGIAVRKDRAQAESWLRCAIASGDPEAVAEALKELDRHF